MNPPHAYVFTDGSCTGTGLGAWAAVVILPNEDISQVLFGVANYTTINRCELQPMIDGLRWLRLHYGKTTGLRVIAVSDSETTVRTMSGEFGGDANTDLWQAYEAARRGFLVTPLWRERNTHPYMQFADALCGALRKLLLMPAKRIEEDTPPANFSLDGLTE